MEEFPPNSQKYKGHTPPPATKKEPKNVQKIIEGEVVRRKKPLGKRMLETFIGGDIKSVGPYVLFEVIIPETRYLMFETVKEGFERLVFGESKYSHHRRGREPNRYGVVDYRGINRQAQQRSQLVRRDEPRQLELSHRGRAEHNFDEIILQTRVEAEEVLTRLFDLISQYEQASVADLYSTVGITPDFTDDKWGWTDIRGAGVTRIRSGYLLDLPRPEPLDL